MVLLSKTLVFPLKLLRVVVLPQQQNLKWKGAQHKPAPNLTAHLLLVWKMGHRVLVLYLSRVVLVHIWLALFLTTLV